jgi:hypothetical protein
MCALEHSVTAGEDQSDKSAHHSSSDSNDADPNLGAPLDEHRHIDENTNVLDTIK